LLCYYDIMVLPIAYCLYHIALFRVQRYHFQHTRSHHPARCMLCSIAMPASGIIDPITQLDACSVALQFNYCFAACPNWLHAAICMLCSIAIQSLVCSLHRNGCILGVVSPPAVRAGSSSQCVLHYHLRFRIRASKESLQWRSTHIVCPSVSVGTSLCILYFKICPLVRTLEHR
jgi:hypothetical protein